MARSQITTTPDFLHEWRLSGVDDAITLLNCWEPESAHELEKLLNRSSRSKKSSVDDLLPGWCVGGVCPRTGERTVKGAQFKPSKPVIDPTTQKKRKYLNPSGIGTAPLFLELPDKEFWQRLRTTINSPIVLTEGAKKAGALLSKGLAAISIPGVDAGGKSGRLHPDLEDFCRYGRKIYLAFDRDVVIKPTVAAALHRFARMIAAVGAQIFVLEWDDQHKGIDDFLVNGGNVQESIYNARTIEEWREEQKSEGLELREVETCRLACRFKLVSERLKGRLRWNGLKGEIELDGELCEVEEIRIELALRHNIDVPLDDCTQILTFIARQNGYHPVVDYLHECAANYPPDSDLLSSISEVYFGATQPLHRAYVRKTLISAVARAFQPGCKVDSVCILAGGQGVGKSRFWSIISNGWFDDSIGAVSDKDERLKLHQAWLIEWAELESVFKRKDISAVKSFITTQTDQIRPPYGRKITAFPRPSIIVGSTNFDEFLGDPTGNRRFWVVPVSVDRVPVEELEADRERIWGAAVHAFLGGERWTLPAELIAESAESNRDHELSDPWENPVLDYCETLDKVSVDDVLRNALGLELDKQDRSAQMRVTNLLKANGWTTSREVVQGRRRRFWYSPKFTTVGCPGCPEVVESQTAVEGQPGGQPLGQPTVFVDVEVVQHGAIDVRDNLDNLDNLKPKSRNPEQIPYSASSKSGSSVDADHDPEVEEWEVLTDDGWKKCQLKGSARGSVLSRVTRKLDDAVTVLIEGHRRNSKVAVSDVRRLPHANG